MADHSIAIKPGPTNVVIKHTVEVFFHRLKMNLKAKRTLPTVTTANIVTARRAKHQSSIKFRFGKGVEIAVKAVCHITGKARNHNLGIVAKK
jgi:hypothetical protein